MSLVADQSMFWRRSIKKTPVSFFQPISKTGAAWKEPTLSCKTPDQESLFPRSQHPLRTQLLRDPKLRVHIEGPQDHHVPPTQEMKKCSKHLFLSYPVCKNMMLRWQPIISSSASQNSSHTNSSKHPEAEKVENHNKPCCARRQKYLHPLQDPKTGKLRPMTTQQ